MREETVLLAHGGGGRAARSLIQELIAPIFNNPELERLEDAARITGVKDGMVMTQDSYVVTPLFFPGGDIGRLAVSGTVNDILTSGARPVAISVGLILEEGLSVDVLRRILVSMKETADSVSVPLITGDTKVVERGRGDGIYISTAGVGVLEGRNFLTPQLIEVGDIVLINGPIGNHEAAIIAARNEFSFGIDVTSDCMPLSELMERVLETVPETRCARDPTRGGVSAVLNEMVESTGYGITLEESAVSLDTPVKTLCEVLGMDPLLMANEGKMVIVVPKGKEERCLEAMQSVECGRDSAIIGKVHGGTPRLTLLTAYGTRRVVTMPRGEQLPRIC
jgi:hydrogenase expression/formation protein HypE